MSRLKNLVSRVRWNRVDPAVVKSWRMAMPYCAISNPDRKRAGKVRSGRST